MRFARAASSFLVVLAVVAPAMPVHGTRQDRPRASAARIDVPYAEAQPILETLREDLLPVELRSRPVEDRAARWPAWVSKHDREIRARLARGDEDSIVNLLLFGVTFTRLPRVTDKDAPPPGESGRLLDSALVQGRLTDLVTAIGSPGSNDRLLFARTVAERNGFDPATEAGRAGLRGRISDDLRRVLAENDAYARTKAAGQAAGPVGVIQESTFFRDRGLSSDTSIFPDVAIDQALGALKTNGIVRPDAIRRVAIVGPGLDFADKRDGHDFYPQQTLQPFAVVDSLRRLGLSAAGMPDVVTFDLSGRVNQHLQAARARGRAGQPYLLNIPRDTAARWNPELVTYWERFGDRIGDAAIGSAPPAAGSLTVRSVRVRPDVVASVEPHDLNIVLQRIDLPAGDRFDLVLATNVLVYYDVFDQCLAVGNITRMLKPGGVFLSNTEVPTLPHLPIVRIGYTELAYTDQASAADRLVWLQRSHE